MHHLHNVDDDKMKSSQDYFAEVKTFNAFKEVSLLRACISVIFD